MLNSVRYDMHIIQYCICLQYIISICLRTWPAREAIIRRCPNNTVRVNTLERARARAGSIGAGAGAGGHGCGRGRSLERAWQHAHARSRIQYAHTHTCTRGTHTHIRQHNTAHTRAHIHICTYDKKQETRNKKQETRNKKQETCRCCSQRKLPRY